MNLPTKLIVSNSRNPYYNLAVEEWAVRNIDTSACQYLFLYVNDDSVVIGRNQNIFQEVNLPYCQQNKIAVCRRVSGGGTVFHDKGNLNWTFISPFSLKKVNNYAVFAEPIIKVLKSIGLNAYLNDRNAIMVGETKVSGQAQFTNRKNILSHGTLLISSNIERLNRSIQIEAMQVESKASKSVRSTVKHIQMLCGNNISVQKIAQKIQVECGAENIFDIDEKAIQSKIQALAKSYQSKKWLYERASKCEITTAEFIFQIEKAKIIAVKTLAGKKIENHKAIGNYFQESLVL